MWSLLIYMTEIMVDLTFSNADMSQTNMKWLYMRKELHANLCPSLSCHLQGYNDLKNILKLQEHLLKGHSKTGSAC